ncbi:Mob1 family protein [Pleurostoma richardsiae]|uniref:Mob1 family protein n=1 Tax=Pleurostoma richardsiae TaxID=41990 RepID=A0AA38R6R1_9PEZI|nr:Mob1 family protein [Pleurostoma richardsiae]
MALAPNSPRLPSPPPPAEIQLGPKSPSMGSGSMQRQAQRMEQNTIDTNAKRRVHPGTKAADMAAGPPLVPLNELDSAFQLQEHLAALHYHHTAGNTKPITRETARLLATPPPATDRTLWLYELCRFLIAQCNSLIVGFLFDTPPCSAATCPEMRASEWQFLCAVHDAPKSCCAIDYCCHTLDWAANVVTNPKLFPSRLVALSSGDGHGGAGGDRGAALKSLVNVFRRLHRIFAHAWFQHRGVFWGVENQTGLYVFFKTVCDMYDLLPAENYKLPPEAEGLEATAGGAPSGGSSAPPETERRSQQQQQPQEASAARQSSQRGEGEEESFVSVGRTNTRRHIRSSPSTGSAVTTVMEADEDESTGMASRFRELQITTQETLEEEEPEVAEVPVIVEHDIGERPVVDASPQEQTPVAEVGATSRKEESDPAPTPEAAADKPEIAQEEPVEDLRAEETAPDVPEEAGTSAEAPMGAEENAEPSELEKKGEEAEAEAVIPTAPEVPEGEEGPSTSDSTSGPAAPATDEETEKPAPSTEEETAAS